MKNIRPKFFKTPSIQAINYSFMIFDMEEFLNRFHSVATNPKLSSVMNDQLYVSLVYLRGYVDGQISIANSVKAQIYILNPEALIHLCKLEDSVKWGIQA